MKWIAALLVVAAFAIAFAHADEPTAKSGDEFVRPFPIVGIARGASDAQRGAAKQIADAIGVSEFVELERNPTCCVWIEVSGWTPNPGKPGYFIINQGGGSIISASDEEQLKTAIDQFKQSVRKGANGPEVPVGMMTSYRIVAAKVVDR